MFIGVGQFRMVVLEICFSTFADDLTRYQYCMLKTFYKPSYNIRPTSALNFKHRLVRPDQLTGTGLLLVLLQLQTNSASSR
jgi:hypothetical protein